MVPSFRQWLESIRVCRPELNSVSKVVLETIVCFATFQMHNDDSGSLLDREVLGNKLLRYLSMFIYIFMEVGYATRTSTPLEHILHGDVPLTSIEGARLRV